MTLQPDAGTSRHNTTDAIRVSEDIYEDARCGLPDCGEQLFIIWSASRALYLSDTAADLAKPTSAHTTTWRVECGAGHVVLLPPDTAGDNYEFGCGHNDMRRLRRVVRPAAAGRDAGGEQDA